ncbi:MAG: hypothetical protein U0X20_02715 [Caldilineaceae bacterium]
MLKTEMKQAPLQASSTAGLEQRALRRTGAAAPEARAARAAARVQGRAWGWLPELSLTTALGLLLIAATNYGAYTSAEWATPLFWSGLLLMVLPAVYRLASADATRSERIGVLLLLVAALYTVKLMHSPFTFTFADEFVHTYNAEAALASNHLFNANSILRVTAYYPGLAAVTAALADVSGLPVMASAAVLIGAARLLLVLAIFLLFEQVSRSPRVAGLGAALFMGQPSFLYWSAQFAYESLAFPLMVAAVFLAVRSVAARRRTNFWRYTVLALLVIGGITTTHHLSSYALALFLVAWSVLEHTQLHARLAGGLDRVMGRMQSSSPSHPLRRGRAPDLLALIAVAAAVGWLLIVANPTISYLSPVLSQAMLSVVNMIAGEQTSRQLFVSKSGYVAPLLERVTGLGAVVLCLLGLPFGLYQVWRRYARSAVAVLMALAAVAYFAMLGFRLTGAGWETANRAASYLFLGLALVLSMAAAQLWLTKMPGRIGRLVVAAYVGIVFAGGVIAGWPGQQLLAKPYVVDARGHMLLPEGEAAAAFLRSELPPGVIGADEANGRLVLARAQRYVLAGRYPFIRDIVSKPEYDRWQLQALRDYQMQYVVVDRRNSSWDNMVGYFFAPVPHPSERTAEWLAPEQYRKYDKEPAAERLFDSGNIVIYDIGALNHGQPAK